MEQKHNFLQKSGISKKELIFFLGVVLIIFCIPLLLTNSWFYIKDFTVTGNIGDTIGGITAPFLSVLGSVLVFIAFKEQVKANNLVQKQFIQQNFDQLFFRLMDNQQVKILNYSINANKEYKSFEALDYLNKQLLKEMNKQMCNWGRHIICKYTEKIADDYFVRIYTRDTVLGNAFPIKEAIQLKNDLLTKNYNDRWEYLKSYVGSTNHESAKQKDVLESIANVYFYKIPFNGRQDIYSRAYSEVYKKNSVFLDNYFNGIVHIMKVLNSISKDTFHLDYFKTNISNTEKSIIFYNIAAKESSQEIALLLENMQLLNNLYNNNSFFIDAPGYDEFQEELSASFKQYY